MKKIAILANRSSGQELAVAHTFTARSILWGWECDYFFPKSSAELQVICRNLSPDQYEAVIVIGGDGTCNQVIRSLEGRLNSIPIYPFPGGTANDLSNELGLKADWNQVQELLDRRHYDLIDLIEANGFPFATVGGVGIGSILTEEFNRRRRHSMIFRDLSKFLHFQIYTLLSAKTILLSRDYIHRLHIKAAGFDEKIKTPALFICNQNHLGGTLKVAPLLDNTDQRFNVLIVTTSSRSGLLRAMSQLQKGFIPESFFVFSTDQLTLIDLDHKKIRIFGDGEPLHENSKLVIKVLPKMLRVYRSLKSDRTLEFSRDEEKIGHLA